MIIQMNDSIKLSKQSGFQFFNIYYQFIYRFQIFLNNHLQPMQEGNEARILKIVSPFEFLIEDLKDKSKLNIQVKPTSCKAFSHLLPELSQANVSFQVQKKKSFKIRQEFSKGTIYLNGKELTSLYRQQEQKVYMGSEIQSVKKLNCFVSKVQCLKLELVNLSDLKYITFYFSQLKLVRMGNLHPKEMWERSQSYFKHQMQGEFIELKVAGSEKYKEQMNIFGDIVRLRDRQNIREKTIRDGYAQLSKDAKKYLNPDQIEYYNTLRSKAKASNIGFWQTSKNISKSNLQVQDFKYRHWQQWAKEGKLLSKIKNEEQEFKNIIEELNKISRSQGKLEHGKIKIIVDVLMCLFTNQVTKKYLKFLEQVVKILCLTFSNIQIPFYQQIDNLDFIKSINKMLIFLIFYHEELQKLVVSSKGEKIPKNNGMDLQKCIKFIFKLCFLGNQTFHDKLFGKRKENNYEDFNFEYVYLDGGFSSLSECSDYQDADKLSREEKKERKLQSAHTKIRINSTYLLSFFFKMYPNIVQNYWQMCITSNILTKDFLNHVTKLRITTSEVKMNGDQKKEIVNFMRSNFGDHSLILLSFFQRNNKVKSNSITCLLNMISNFQGKKLIATTQSVYIEKLLNKTKSSFVPKSFIIFSGLRNALYFLLFVLYYQKNLQIIILIFKTLCELCNNCTLIDKMSFEEGMGLLLRNYIVPVLEFQWSITELEELKILIINFLGVLMSSSRKWPQIESNYLKSSTSNINLKLINVMSNRKSAQNHFNQDKIVEEILNYFTKLCKNYFSVLFYKTNEGTFSIWSYLDSIFGNHINRKYPEFVEEVFKSYLDEQQIINNEANRGLLNPSIEMNELSNFLVQFLKVYYVEVTSSNYIHLVGILTYVDYKEWSQPEFVYPRNFLLHCFNSFVSENHQEPNFQSIHGIKTNTFMRIALIKLVGYMSFCPEFQSQEITKKSVSCLLELSKQYKSFNSIVKISWGLSNWSKVPSFRALSQKMLKQCLDYMVSYSGSDKEKIASNCTRGIGFFVANVGKKFNLQDCRKHIIKNLSHPVLKVRTNSTKTLISLAEDLLEQEIKELLPLLQQNILKNNYHLQMETLQLLKKIGNPIKGKRLLGLFASILKNLMKSTTIQYEFSEIKTIRQLRFKVLSQIFENVQEIKENSEFSKDIVTGICEFLARDCNDRNDSSQNNSKIREKEFEKSEQAEKLIFNKKGIEKFNDEKVIETQLMNKGYIYKGGPEELQLIHKIRQFCGQNKDSLNQEWQKLSGLRVQGNTILIDFSALQVGQEGEDYEYIVME